ncbi:ninja-family protein AFP2-like [Chenopodium quinoa]|uniref:ninja-family protein AFP2-like n=1 Tax=Chenopodium quinoa TaxID=63459 RepID=UPI000B76E29F|nr:ninja-family protein AFP2-like [Chenopodium quinoa]
MDSSSQLYSSSSSKGMGETVNISRGFSMSSSSNSSRHRSKEMESLSLEISKYPRDLLQTFLGNNTNKNSGGRNRSDDSKLGEEEEDDEGLNLGLGLSLGGKFGVDKSKNLGGLIRSSSIAGTMPLFREDDTGVAFPPIPGNNSNSNSNSNSNNNLVRTSSLPVETEEEWRKRKEMQTLRRMEAKRRRSEKQRVLKETGGVGGSGGSGGEEKGVEGLKLRARLEREQQCLGLTSKLIGSSMGNLFGSSKPPPPSNNLGRRTTFGSLQGFLIAQDQAQAQAQAQAQPQQGSSQGSGESQGGTSSDASELESKTHQGSSSCGDTRSPPSSTHSLQDRGSQETMGPSVTKDNPFHRASGPELESSSKQPESTDHKKKETASGGIEDMPCVFTIGDGPNGRKVEGILYKYGKGEEVRIMCVCHGTFHSPKEFVKHAGGRDVEHPLRHIVVSPSTSPFQ